jgi:hypothetical protein
MHSIHKSTTTKINQLGFKYFNVAFKNILTFSAMFSAVSLEMAQQCLNAVRKYICRSW